MWPFHSFYSYVIDYLELAFLNDNLVQRPNIYDVMENTRSSKRLRTDMNTSHMGEDARPEALCPSVLQSLLEKEFTCAICHEILINSTALRCGHCYCEYCICRWLSRNTSCPVCKKKTMKTTRLIILDSFIRQVYELLLPTEEYRARLEEMELRTQQASLGSHWSASESEMTNSTSEDTGSSIFSLSSSTEDSYESSRNSR
ncbi:hypothetical protein CRM22_007948 [Opisthorchis felineus]|uniref:RING-type domain-containing protein n=1 Tax=Opisthorchis felineus TaxID=147828 RepID=A0A4S2LLG2_OPIFE|nr:hypothetical protein CRM22_007948 [Opisthorchis felineus]